MELMYELPEHRLPAFRTPYYTNDIRVTGEGYETFYELRDEDGNVIERNADGNYYSLDHTKTYTVYVADKARGSFTFDNIYTDIELIIRAQLAYAGAAEMHVPEANDDGVAVVISRAVGPSSVGLIGPQLHESVRCVCAHECMPREIGADVGVDILCQAAVGQRRSRQSECDDV